MNLKLLGVGALALASGLVVEIAWTRLSAPVSNPLSDPEERNSPGDSDYFAVRYGYHGDPQHLHFEQNWLLAATEQDRYVASAVPAGRKTLRAKSTSGVTLDPNAFTLLGPQPLNGLATYLPGAGRTNAVLSDPDDPNVAWIGSDGGGIWKTRNCCSAATTWEVKTDFADIAGSSISDLTMDPLDHDVLYAGTGDLRFTNLSFGAAGVLKSTDGGETWVPLGMDVFNARFPSSGFPQYQAVGKVIVDPNDTNTVVAGTKTGVYFSFDAGKNWTGPCYTNDFTGQRQDITALRAVNHSGTTYLYAGVGARGYATAAQPDLANNGANGLYRTTLPVSGCPATADWTPLDNGLPASGGKSNASIGRLELAVAPSDSQTLYAMFANASAGVILGVYSSHDGGDSWTQIGTPPPNTDSIVYYDAGITVSPNDPSTFFLSTVNLYRSVDGGLTYADLTKSYEGGVVHPDNQARVIVGGDANHVLNGNDGGVYYLSNALTAMDGLTDAHWVSLNDNLATLEAYYGDITANFATSPSAGATAGFQDNGNGAILFNGEPTAGAWTDNNGLGDGTVSRIEPVLGNVWYTSLQYGRIYASTSGAFGQQFEITPRFNSTDRPAFLTPFDLYRYGDVNTPGSGCDSTNGCTHIILGTQRVWESTNGGLSSWTVKTSDLTKNNLIVGSDNRSYINQIHYAVSDPSTAMVATNDGNIQYVFDLGGSGAATAVDVTDNNVLLPNRPMLDVATDPANPLTGYAAVGGFSPATPGTPGHLFQVMCSARCATFTWADKSGNLPDTPTNAVIVNPHIPSQVLVGTDIGLYFTNDVTVAAPIWTRFEGLPRTKVWSFAIDRGFTTLAAFTRSRGVWVWPLPSAPISSADLETTLTPSGKTLDPGRAINYTLSVTNHGPNAADNVTLTSPMPAGVTFAANGGDCTTAFPCVFPSIAVGATVRVTTTLCVPSSYAGRNPIPLLGAASSDVNDPIEANNSASGGQALVTDWLFGNGFERCP